MKSLLKYASMLCFVFTIFALTACGGQPNFDVSLEHGRDLAVETDHFSLTNQEVFELVAGGYLNWMNPGVSTILDWADYIILSDLVEIDEDVIEQELEFIENFFDEDEVTEMLTIQGFPSIDDYIVSMRLELMREQAVEDAVEITDEDILESYEEWFVPGDEGFADTDEDTEIPELDEVREMIEDMLRSEILEVPGFSEEILVGLRAEAGLTIYSSYFATRYENLLTAWGISNVDVETGNNAAIASVDGHYLSAEELFDIVIRRFAMNPQSRLFDYIDRNVLNEIYNVNNSVIRDIVNEEKLTLLEWFYPQMESRGLLTEQQIFDFYLSTHLRDLAFDDAFMPLSEENLQELYETHIEDLIATFETENVEQRGARHILIVEDDDRSLDEAREFAEELIERLRDVDEDAVEDLFASLAEEYSACGSAERGGDLDIFGPGQMVSEFEEATFGLELYEFTTEPVETLHGFHIIYLYYISESDDEELNIPTFEEVRATLIEDEAHRLRTTPQYLESVMIELREDQNLIFHNEQLQIQYIAIIEQNRRIVEDVDIDYDINDNDADNDDDDADNDDDDADNNDDDANDDDDDADDDDDDADDDNDDADDDDDNNADDDDDDADNDDD